MNSENPRQKKLRTGVKAKYTAYLDDLYIRINNNEIILMNDLISSYKISKQLSAILQSKKIIKKLSRHKYIWIGKKPSPEMVDMIIEVSRINAYNYQPKEVGQKEINFRTPIVKLNNKPVTKPVTKPLVKIIKPSTKIKEQKQNYSFSILWGLIKIQKS